MVEEPRSKTPETNSLAPPQSENIGGLSRSRAREKTDATKAEGCVRTSVRPRYDGSIYNFFQCCHFSAGSTTVLRLTAEDEKER